MSDLSASLVAALADLTVVGKTKTADTGKYSYSYADLADLVELTRPVLSRHGLVAMTPVHAHGDGLACTVEILHTSGEAKRFDPLPFPEGRDAQATGSAITYHRRYALLAALGMAADDDDDGATASPRPTGDAPSEKQLAFAKRLGEDLGESAKTVVPSIVEEHTGRKAKLSELTKAEITPVIDALKEQVDRVKAEHNAESAAFDERKADAVARAEAGEEPFEVDT